MRYNNPELQIKMDALIADAKYHDISELIEELFENLILTKLLMSYNGNDTPRIKFGTFSELLKFSPTVKFDYEKELVNVNYFPDKYASNPTDYFDRIFGKMELLNNVSITEIINILVDKFQMDFMDLARRFIELIERTYQYSIEEYVRTQKIYYEKKYNCNVTVVGFNMNYGMYFIYDLIPESKELKLIHSEGDKKIYLDELNNIYWITRTVKEEHYNYFPVLNLKFITLRNKKERRKK